MKIWLTIALLSSGALAQTRGFSIHDTARPAPAPAAAPQLYSVPHPPPVVRPVQPSPVPSPNTPQLNWPSWYNPYNYYNFYGGYYRNPGYDGEATVDMEPGPSGTPPGYDTSPSSSSLQDYRRPIRL